jgi:hypothetical protein
MISQKYSAGKTVINVEIAESLDDAKKNDFAENEFSRYLLNGKKISYMEMINHIIKESKHNRASFIPDKNELKKIQQEMLENQKKEIIKNLKDIQNLYKKDGHPQAIIDDIDKKIKSLNEDGMRIKK